MLLKSKKQTSIEQDNALLDKVPLMRSFIIFSVSLFAIILILGSIAHLITIQPMIRENRQLYMNNLLDMVRINLEIAVNNEVAVAVQIADSPIIQSYLRDPSNEQFNTLAIEELLARRSAFASNSIFWMSVADMMFHFDNDISYLVDPNDPENYWFDLTIYNTEVYNFNINYNPELDAISLWINVPIFDENRNALGMVGTGINLSSFIEQIYYNYEGMADVFFFNQWGEVTGARDVNLIVNKDNINHVLERTDFDVMAHLPEMDSDYSLFHDSRQNFIGISSIPEIDWYLIALLPITIQDYWTPVTHFFIITIICMALIILVFNLFIYRLVKPLRAALNELFEKELKEKSLNARYEFLSRMSHEIRTPIHAILGLSDLSIKHNKDPNSIDSIMHMHQIKNSSTQLLAMVDNILDLYEIEHGKLTFQSSSFELQETMQQMYAMYKDKAQAKNQALILHGYESITERIIGDEKRVMQVLQNLISNAIKFTPEFGRIEVNVHNISQEEDKHKALVLQFSVRDNGKGIPQEKQQAIFAPFEQVDEKGERQFNGVGLGLCISKYIVEQMGGQFWLVSEPELGSIFYFTCTFAIDPHTQPMEETVNLTGKTILLVDDVELNRDMIIMMLEGSNVKIDCAHNGAEALAMFQAKPDKYDLILMDINMPIMDGLEATRLIRKIDHISARRVPIIAATANVLTHEVEKYLAHGMTDHIGKPIDMEILHTKLSSYLKSSLQCHIPTTLFDN